MPTFREYQCILVSTKAPVFFFLAEVVIFLVQEFSFLFWKIGIHNEQMIVAVSASVHCSLSFYPAFSGSRIYHRFPPYWVATCWRDPLLKSRPTLFGIQQPNCSLSNSLVQAWLCLRSKKAIIQWFTINLSKMPTYFGVQRFSRIPKITLCWLNRCFGIGVETPRPACQLRTPPARLKETAQW